MGLGSPFVVFYPAGFVECRGWRVGGWVGVAQQHGCLSARCLSAGVSPSHAHVGGGRQTASAVPPTYLLARVSPGNVPEDWLTAAICSAADNARPTWLQVGWWAHWLQLTPPSQQHCMLDVQLPFECCIAMLPPECMIWWRLAAPPWWWWLQLRPVHVCCVPAWTFFPYAGLCSRRVGSTFVQKLAPTGFFGLLALSQCRA